MKEAPLIQGIWERGGPYVGDEGRPNAYVTVQMPWPLGDSSVRADERDHVIHGATSVGTGTTQGEVLRWYQKRDNSQVERLIPNVSRINIDRSIDQDAATCSITVSNQWMFDNADPDSGAVRTIGIPGFFTPSHGASLEAQARWGHRVNEWAGVLVPNAVIRTYQGYGGTDKSLAQALEDGNVVLTGVWLVDSVDVGTDGRLGISCRDMMKLLIVQQLYPPLVPADKYPLQYYRYVIENREIEASASARFDFGDVPTKFVDSSNDRRYPGHLPEGVEVLGRRGSETADGDPSTFALSVGYATQDEGCDWWEYEVGEYCNAVWILPWAGNFTAYVSVMENNMWQGSEAVPHTAYGAWIPYVTRSSLPWETGIEILLPRVYNAQRIRISLMNHGHTGPLTPATPWYVGLREVQARTSEGNLGKSFTQTRRPVFYAADTYRDPEDLNTFGYMTTSTMHQVDMFGDMRAFEETGGHGSCNHQNHGCAMRPQNDGYWILCQAGHVTAFGDAPFYGDVSEQWSTINIHHNRTSGIISTPSGNGYWIVGWDGRIFAFGDATPYANEAPPAGEFFHAASGHPTHHGLWLVATNGNVVTRGAATFYGNWSKGGHTVTNGGQEDGESEIAIDVMPTINGDGYWILTSGGRVDAKGAADFHGEIDPPVLSHSSYNRFYHLIPSPTGDAYMLFRGDGRLFMFGNPSGTRIMFGGPTPGSQGQLRRNGNYLDYCLDEESEILTPQGWKKHDQLVIGDQVLGIDPETGDSVWQDVEFIYRKHRENHHMIRMKGASFDALTTPEHRWLVKKEGSYNWAWTTSDAMKTTDLVPLTVGESGAHLPTEPKHSDEFVELVAWFWTEGWWTTYSAALAQSERINPGFTARIRGILTTLFGEPGSIPRGPTYRRPEGAPLWRERYRDDGVVTFILSKPISDFLKGCVSRNKTVSWEFLNELTKPQLDLFIETSVDADGERNADGSARSLPQAKFERLEALEYACILTGRPVTHKKRPKRDSFELHFHKVPHMAPFRSGRSGTGRMRVTHVHDYTGVVWCPTVEHHNYIARRNGSIYLTGNSDIVKELLLWSGFLLYDPATPSNSPPPVYGNIESTGAWSPEPLPDSLFDKRPVLDALTELKETVGYILYVDDSGGVRFEPPNWWGRGNVTEGGMRTTFTPEIDERVNLVSYRVGTNDEALRSMIVISSEEPDEAGETTITTVLRPQTGEGLKGLLVPAMWVNGWFQDPREQRIMADLIGLHIWFQQRIGNVTMAANPCIQINDQVRIYEQITSEVFIHYVRGVSSSQDLDTGSYEMTLTTNWLGTPERGGDWVVTGDQSYSGSPDHYVLDPATLEWLQETESLTLSSNPSVI